MIRTCNYSSDLVAGQSAHYCIRISEMCKCACDLSRYHNLLFNGNKLIAHYNICSASTPKIFIDLSNFTGISHEINVQHINLSFVPIKAGACTLVNGISVFLQM